MLTCGTCGNEEPEGSQFCGSCGAPFVPADPHPAHAAPMEASATLICASCGNEEPEGSRFCGNCSAPLCSPISNPFMRPRSRRRHHRPSRPLRNRSRRASPNPASRGKHRGRWIAMGIGVALLVAGGAVGAVLALAGGDGSTGATPTEQPPATTTESPASRVEPDARRQHRSSPGGAHYLSGRPQRSGPLARPQAWSRSPRYGKRPMRSPLGVVGTQGFLDGLASSDSETATLSLLRNALSAHLAYAGRSPDSSSPAVLTTAQAQAAIPEPRKCRPPTRRSQSPNRLCWAPRSTRLTTSACSELVPPVAKPPFSTTARRSSTSLRCLSASGPTILAARVGALGRTREGVAARVRRRAPEWLHPVRRRRRRRSQPHERRSTASPDWTSRPDRGSSELTGQVAIDESSSSSQRGSRVTWTVFYAGAPSARRPSSGVDHALRPEELDCEVPVGRLRRWVRRATASNSTGRLASSGSLWAGLLDPTIVAEVSR